VRKERRKKYALKEKDKRGKSGRKEQEKSK
jgi:hypothetical protein